MSTAVNEWTEVQVEPPVSKDITPSDNLTIFDHAKSDRMLVMKTLFH